MNFIKKEIKGEYITVVDIGSYKIRVGICKLKNRNIELVGYGEKRQNYEDTAMGEFSGIEGICENIALAIKKAEKEALKKIDNIIINFPFGEVFFSAKKINYRREFGKSSIDKKEMNKIIKKVETVAYKGYLKEIEESTPYEQGDLKIIASNISRIKIEGQEVDNLEHNKGENINICLLNAFISYDKYNLIKYIAKAVNKTIVKVIPSEIGLIKMWSEKKDLVIVDIGSNHTSIILKKDNYIKGIQKINLGINDLIKVIAENTNKTKIDIINTIDSEEFSKEKEKFLSIFEDCLVLGLEEILKGKICPNEFFITGGGANNFLKNYIKQINLAKKSIKIIGNIEIIDIKIDFAKDIYSKSNLAIISMMKTAEDLINKEKDPLVESLEKAIKEIENKG